MASPAPTPNSKEELLAKLTEGPAAWNEWRAANPQVQPDLSEASLKKTDLKGFDLRGVNLRAADLSEADLKECDLSRADLRWANLSLADLRKNGAKIVVFSVPDVDIHDFLRGLPESFVPEKPSLFFRKPDIKYANLSFARGLTPEMVRQFLNWRMAFFDDDMLKKLDLPKDHNEKLQRHRDEENHP